ncbi:MAG: sulfatase [Phycisphaerales bacterium]
MIVMDAVRAENLSIYGYGKPTTPNLERHADRFAIYENAITAAPWTLPSTTSLFTGTYSSTHRLVIDGDRLSGRFTTLAELLKDDGYRTAKVTGTVPYVSDFSGLDRGFGHAFEPPPPAVRRWWRTLKRRRVADRPNAMREGLDLGLDLEEEHTVTAGNGLTARARYWMTGLMDVGADQCLREARRIWKEPGEEPRFIYVHLQETHAPYRPPHRFRRRFIRPELHRRNFGAINQRPNPHDVGIIKQSAEEYEILTGLYDGCIAYLDDRIGALLDDLARTPEFDDSLIVVTADHGDCLGRHGVLGHQFVVYDALTHIPWLVKWPADIGVHGRRKELVQNTDFAPTVCALLGVEPRHEYEGIDILNGERAAAISELLKPFGQSAVKQRLHERAPHWRRAALAARSRSHKLIVYSNDQPDEFFDLAQDPTESVNLLERGGLSGMRARAHEALCAEVESRRSIWREAAAEIDRRVFEGDENEIDPEVEERLRALGYLD